MKQKEPIELEKIQKQLFQLDLLNVEYPESQDSITWSTCKSSQQVFQKLEVSFARPIKSMEKMTNPPANSSTQWVAFYNGQLSNILVDYSALPRQEQYYTFQAYLLTERCNKIVRVTPLIDDKNRKIHTKENQIELIGLKFQTPEKITQKKECIHHIVMCAIQGGSEIIGLSLCTGFLLKSRKKSHQQKGLDTSYFKPGDLQQQITQKKGKDNNVIIKNSLQGLNDYFTSPNIRHKIVNPFFLSYKFSNAVTLYLSKEEFPTNMKEIDIINKIFCQFAAIRPEGSQKYSLALVLSDNLAHNKDEISKTGKDNADKAFIQAKISKCLYVRLSSDSPQWIQMKDSFYPLQISTSKARDELYKAYVKAYNYQSATGHPQLLLPSQNPQKMIIEEPEIHSQDEKIGQNKDSKFFSSSVIIVINQRNQWLGSSQSSAEQKHHKSMISIPVFRIPPTPPLSPPQAISVKYALLNSEDGQQIPTEKQEYQQNELNDDCHKKIKIDQDATSSLSQPNELHGSQISIGQNNNVPESIPSPSVINATNHNNSFNCYQSQLGQFVEIGQIKVEKSSQEQQQYPSSSQKLPSPDIPSYFPLAPLNLQPIQSNSQQLYQQNHLQQSCGQEQQQLISRIVSSDCLSNYYWSSFYPQYFDNVQFHQQFNPQLLIQNLESYAMSRNQSYFLHKNTLNNNHNNKNKL